MDKSRHTVTNYLSDEKAQTAINDKMLKRLGFIYEQFYEVELAKSEIEHKEQKFVGFLILQYARLSMLEQYYIFFDKYCDATENEELEMDTDSLYLAMAKQDLFEGIQPEMTEPREALQSADCDDLFFADAIRSFSPAVAALRIRSMIEENLDFSKQSTVVLKCCVYVAKLAAAMISVPTSLNSAVKVSTNGYRNRAVMVPWRIIGDFSRKNIIFSSKKDVSEHKIMLLLLLSKRRKDCFTFTLSEESKLMDFTPFLPIWKNILFCLLNFVLSKQIFQTLIH